jgi:carboxyl-terminal processing protease
LRVIQSPQEDWVKLSSIAGSIVLVASSLATAQNTAQISPRAYVEEALNYMQESALNKHTINWQAVRERTLLRAKDAKTTWDTYPAIAYAITQLGEKHTWFQIPDNLPLEQRQLLEAGIKRILARPDPAKPSPFMPSKEMKGHIIRKDQAVFAYVVVPMCIGRFAEWEKNGPDFQQFADKLHALVLELQAQKPLGWIIDLRGNSGGNMWPMLAGIGTVLGEGDLGAFVSPDNEHAPWFYKEGKAGMRDPHDPPGKEEISAEVKPSQLAFTELPWVAVLFDRGTGSSGEAIAISFAGRKRERSLVSTLRVSQRRTICINSLTARLCSCAMGSSRIVPESSIRTDWIPTRNCQRRRRVQRKKTILYLSRQNNGWQSRQAAHISKSRTA